MTLSEIETILEDLALRHQNLNGELLSTLLLSAGWEDKDIKDALTLFKQKTPLVPVNPSTTPQPETLSKAAPPTVSEIATPKEEAKPFEEITFYQPDGSEEKELHALPETEVVKREKIELPPKVITAPVVLSAPAASEPITPLTQESVVETREEPIVPKGESLLHKYTEVEELTGDRSGVSENIVLPRPEVIEAEKKVATTAPLPQAPVFIEKEPQSLIVEASVAPKRKQTAIPEDLPLLPFENSPHIWSFSRYKNVFHGEGEKEVVKDLREVPREDFIENTIVEAPKPRSPVEVKQAHVPAPIVEEDFIVEKTPLTKQDESLVFLAGVMLLVIILILGYMYSNGRL